MTSDREEPSHSFPYAGAVVLLSMMHIYIYHPLKKIQFSELSHEAVQTSLAFNLEHRL